MNFPRLLLLILPLLQAGYGASAETLCLETCRNAAKEKSRLPEMESISERDHTENDALIERAYLPRIGFYGSVHYQSDSPDPASLSDLPFELVKMDKLQYHAGLMVFQPIYSGGSRKIRKEINGIDREIENQENRNGEFEILSAVDELFLEIVLIDKKKEITSTQREAVVRKLNDARAAFEQGTGYKSGLLTLEAGILDIDATLAGYDSGRKAAVRMLSSLTGLSIPEDTEFQVPSDTDVCDFESPAISTIELQARKITFQQNLEKAKVRPCLNAFGTVGYGKWPLDFFSRNPDFFGIVGLSLNIPISSWGDLQHKNRILSNAREKLNIRKEALSRRLEVDNLRFDGEIERLENMIGSTEASIEKHEELCRELETMVSSGVTSSSEYLDAVNECCTVKIRKEVYSIIKLKTQLQKNRNLLK